MPRISTRTTKKETGHFVTKNQLAEKKTTRLAERKDTEGSISSDLARFQMRWPYYNRYQLALIAEA